MKPFNLQSARAGKPVQTGDGRAVRILAFDAKGSKMPICGLVLTDDMEVPNCWSLDGQFIYQSQRESKYDLVMAPEREERWMNIYSKIDALSMQHKTPTAAQNNRDYTNHAGLVKLTFEDSRLIEAEVVKEGQRAMTSSNYSSSGSSWLSTARSARMSPGQRLAVGYAAQYSLSQP